MKDMSGRKGEKSLQMIFGLFILLIISLVVLSLFFKFTEKSSSQMSTASTEYFSKAAVDKSIQECQNLCDTIHDINGILEFCGKVQKVDFDGDNALLSKISRGRWDFCEDQVPCFVLVDNCKQGQYDGFKCKQVLLDKDNHRMDYYIALNNTGMGGTCRMSTSSLANWKVYYMWNDTTKFSR